MMETYRKEDIRRGDIYYADLRPVVGSEQGGNPSCGHSAEQCGQPAQSHSDCSCDHQPER